jgi:hypothetical protein
MDATKLSEIFASLKNLLSTHESGKQWASGAPARPMSPTYAFPSNEWRDFGATEADIVENAEAMQIASCGGADQPRLTRQHSFTCGAHPVTEPHRLGASMVLDGRQFYLGQILLINRGQQSLTYKRCLLALGEHRMRKVRLAWKLQDVPGFQICYQDRKTYHILRHGQGWLELNEAPEPHGVGSLVITFL